MESKETICKRLLESEGLAPFWERLGRRIASLENDVKGLNGKYDQDSLIARAVLTDKKAVLSDVLKMKDTFV